MTELTAEILATQQAEKTKERASDAESTGAAASGEKQPTERRPEQLQGRRAQELIEPVRFHQALFGHESRHDGVKGGGGKSCRGADDQGHRP